MIELPSIQQLENFIIYSKVKDIATAAREANVTRSAFSFQMKKLEEIVGTQLVVHGENTIELTKEGQIFLAKAEKIVSELIQSLSEMKKLAGEEVSLSVGALMSLGDVFINQHLIYFKKYNTNIKINVYNLEAKELINQLEADKLDIVSSFSLKDLQDDEYENIFFCDEEMVYYAPNIEHLGNIINVEEIAQYPMVQYSPYYLMNSTIKNYFSKLGCHPQVEAWFATPYAIMHYCQQNQVGAVLPKRLLNAMGFFDGYYDIEPDFTLKCHLLYKKTNPKYKYIKIFIDYINTLYNKNNNN